MVAAASRLRKGRREENEIDTMAEVEHARYLVERFLNGWKWGKKTDKDKKINEALVGWSDLSEDYKNFDRDAVEHIPDHLEKAEIEAYREPKSGTQSQPTLRRRRRKTRKGKK